MNLTKKIYNKIKNHALLEIPNECCGLVIEMGDKKSLEIHPCKNTASNSTVNFKISYRDYLQAYKLGKIIAYYHSHSVVEALNDFSELDKFNSSNHKIPLILYHVINDEFKIFNGKQSEYIGLKFCWNTQDCVSLVELFYKKEFNIQIQLQDEARDINWFKLNPNKIIDNISKYEFQKIYDSCPIDLNNLKYGDLIGIKYNRNESPSHLMIYLGKNQILHQRINTYSTIEIYNETLKQLTSCILRHKQLC